jgi:hypothetical protein
VAKMLLMLSLFQGWMLSFDDCCYLIGNMPESGSLISNLVFLVSFGFSSHVVGSICARNELVVSLLNAVS